MAEHKQSGSRTVELTTVPVAYLKPSNINTFSMWHTAYVADPIDKTKLHRLEIVGGKARNLPQAVYDLFADAGILTTERPRRQGDEE